MSSCEQQAETIDVPYHLHGLWARNAAQVWVLGDDGDILHSTDGGKHWQQQKSGTEEELISIYGSDSQLWVLGAAGTILHSKDDGEHWQPQKSGTRLQLSSVYASGSQLWTVGENGVALHSTDGGLNWQRQRAESLPSV